MPRRVSSAALRSRNAAQHEEESADNATVNPLRQMRVNVHLADKAIELCLERCSRFNK